MSDGLHQEGAAPVPPDLRLVQAGRPFFQAAVLEHIRDHLPADAWAEFRRAGEDGTESPLTAAQLVASATSCDTMTLRELVYHREFKTIATIGTSPVLFLGDIGVYAWSTTWETAWCLTLWLTDPTYPPGW